MNIEDNEQSTVDVSNESSSTTPEPASTGAPEGTSNNTQSQDPANLPFHEHPRWKEVMAQRDQSEARAKNLETQYRQLEAKLSELSSKPTTKAEDALLSRLKGIDPEFGERFAKLDATQQELAELKEWKQAMDQEKVRNQAVSMLKDLHAQNKVPVELQAKYDREIEYMALRDPNLGLKDLPNLYKSVHDEYTKMFESRDRASREAYVTAKKGDASVPVPQGKGKPVKSGSEPTFSKDPALAKDEAVSMVLKRIRANNSL